MSLPLPEQAEQLLRLQAETADLLALGVACHGRMLELEERDIEEAIRHAVAGAALFKAVSERPDPRPEWLAAHEEQCCRYGAIWIHARLGEALAPEPHWPDLAVTLLRRMEQLHAEPLPWAVAMASDLRRWQEPEPAAAAGSSLRLVVVGNCQSHPLLLGLQRALPAARIHYCPPVHLAQPEDVRLLHAQLRSADWLVAQRVQPGYREGLGLDTPTLCALLPEAARAVVLPNLHYEGHHPWIGYAHDPDGRLAALEAESPLGPYHDHLAMAAAARGLAPGQLLQPDPPPELLELIRRHHLDSLAELQRRELDCTVSISDWIARQHRERPVAHTINHPTQTTLDQVLRRLLAALALPHQLDDALFDAHEHLGALSIPIHPWVRQALALGAWAGGWGQRRGTPLSIEQQLAESLAFYRQHPWIGIANAAHPRRIWAEACLDLLLPAGGSPPARPLVDLLLLAAGHEQETLLLGSLERASGAAVASLDGAAAGEERLPWQRAAETVGALAPQPLAVVSRRISRPPAGRLARLTVCFLRDPLARVRALHLQACQGLEPPDAPEFEAFVAALCRSPLANGQTRLLSPQDEDWAQRQGWAARPELIDLRGPELFVGVVERFDASLVALEHQLEQLGCPLDLAYPRARSSAGQAQVQAAAADPSLPADFALIAATELDSSLHRRALERLAERLAAIPDLQTRMSAFEARCDRLASLAPLPQRAPLTPPGPQG